MTQSENKNAEIAEKFKKLLDDFNLVKPKNEDFRTFLDIIRVYYDRFEERCSKILGFFLDPNAEHGLGGLFIKTLIDSIKKKDKDSFEETGDNFNYSTVEIHPEEQTYCAAREDDQKKRIDINIETDSFVISIENKIDAAINNPFSIYVEHCEKKYREKRGKKVIYVLLSLNPIKENNDLEKLHGDYKGMKWEYIKVTYSMLFDRIKHRIGLYINECNKSYLPFLFDFIKTIENQANNSNMEINELISERMSDIKELEEYVKNFNNEAYHDSLQRIREVHEVLLKTDKNWYLYNETNQDIIIQLPFQEGIQIGIQCDYYDQGSFKEGKVVACPMNVYMRIWPERNMESIFKRYNDSKMGKKFSVNFKDGDKTKLYFDPIDEVAPTDIANKISQYLTALEEFIKIKE